MKVFMSFFVSICLGAGAATAGDFTVIQPDGSGDRVAEGIDFAKQEIGNPWDMSEARDVVLSESFHLTNESVSGGIYTGQSTDVDPRVWMLFPGQRQAVRLDSGERFPIDPSHYRYLTLKIRYTDPGGGVLSANQNLQVFYFEGAQDVGNNTPSARNGRTRFFSVAPEDWQIVTIDLDAEADGAANFTWTQLSEIRGLRIDPLNATGVGLRFEIDWVRLTAAPDAAATFQGSWTSDGSGSYDVFAVDPQGARLQLASNIASTTASLDFSHLPPGDYPIEVRGATSTISANPVEVNDAPQLNFLEPDIRGGEAISYAAVELGNSWEPALESSDVADTANLTQLSYGVNGLQARPTSSDSRIRLNTPVAIDTGFYRSLCFTMEVAGPRDIGTGSVARVLWGNNLTNLTTSEDIVVEEGLNEYCLGDMTTIPIEPSTTGSWAGSVSFLRIDPHEFPVSSECQSMPTPENCRDITLKSVLLAPFDQANPQFNISWNDSDSDDDADISLFADPDTDPDNANEIQITAGISENAAGNSFLWNGPAQVPNGTYNVFARVSDGLNETVRYATGPLVVGAAATATVLVDQPGASGDTVPQGDNWFSAVKGDRLDMSNSTDVTFGQSGNLANQSISNGIFQATATSNDAFFFALHPGAGLSIPTSDYRYLTIKMRVTGVSSPHFVNAIFYQDGSFAPGTFGFTNGIAITNNDWNIVTIDLISDGSGSSALQWDDLTAAAGLRIDPVNKTGSVVEVDWVTLTAESNPNSSFVIDWSTQGDFSGSTFNVELLSDFMGLSEASLLLASGLPFSTTELAAELGSLGIGDYHVRVTAVPGPATISDGPITVTESGIIFMNGFE